jgi:hypothetical protein
MQQPPGGWGSAPEPSRPAWEYKTVQFSLESLSDGGTLNRLGAQGWDLVAVLPGDRGGFERYVFKRFYWPK